MIVRVGWDCKFLGDACMYITEADGRVYLRYSRGWGIFVDIYLCGRALVLADQG